MGCRAAQAEAFPSRGLEDQGNKARHGFVPERGLTLPILSSGVGGFVLVLMVHHAFTPCRSSFSTRGSR